MFLPLCPIGGSAVPVQNHTYPKSEAGPVSLHEAMFENLKKSKLL